MSELTESDPPRFEITSPADAIKVYEIAVKREEQESNGIWARFNYLLAVNIALAGFYLLSVRFARTRAEAAVYVAVSAMGLFLSARTFHTLRGLFYWQRHWVQKARVIEEMLPTWARLYHRKAAAESKRPFSVLENLPMHFFYGRTQPFVAAFFVLWLALLSYAVYLITTLR